MRIKTQTNVWSFIVAGDNPEFVRRAEVIDLKTSLEEATKGLTGKPKEQFLEYIAKCKRIGHFAKPAIEESYNNLNEDRLHTFVGKWKDELTGQKYKYMIRKSQANKGKVFGVDFIRVYLLKIKK